MTRTRAALAAATLTATLVLMGGAASAVPDAPAFPDDCTGMDVVTGNPLCQYNVSWLVFDEAGEVVYTLSSQLPYGPLEEFTMSADGGGVSVEEFLDDFTGKSDGASPSPLPGTTSEWERNGDVVTITYSTSTLTDPGFKSTVTSLVTIDDTAKTATFTAVAGGFATDNLVKLTFPGDVTDASGQIDGNSVTWEPAALLPEEQLTATGSLEPASSNPLAAVPGIVWAALIGLGLGGIAAWLYTRGGKTKGGSNYADFDDDDDEDDADATAGAAVTTTASSGAAPAPVLGGLFAPAKAAVVLPEPVDLTAPVVPDAASVKPKAAPRKPAAPKVAAAPKAAATPKAAAAKPAGAPKTAAPKTAAPKAPAAPKTAAPKRTPRAPQE